MARTWGGRTPSPTLLHGVHRLRPRSSISNHNFPSIVTRDFFHVRNNSSFITNLRAGTVVDLAPPRMRVRRLQYRLTSKLRADDGGVGRRGPGRSFSHFSPSFSSSPSTSSTSTPLHQLALLDAASCLARGEVTSLDLTHACLERAHHTQHTLGLNAFIVITEEEAMRRAEESDARRREGRALGVLDGIPLAFKDNFCMVSDGSCG